MFSATTEYALRAMAWLALTPERLVPTADLAEKTKVPPHYLAKVLQILANNGLITGRRGVRGGYRLARPASDITLLEVVRSIAKIDRITTCPLGLNSHGTRLCPLHRRIDQVAAHVIDLYGSITLESLASDSSGQTPLCESQTPARVTVSATVGAGRRR